MSGKGAILRSYRYATALLEPAAAGLLLWRRRRGKEDPERLPERRGHAGVKRPNKPVVWLHGASVGETVTLLPLIAKLQKRGLGVLVTSGTVTSAKLLAARLPAGVIHQYLPLDVPRYMRRFLDYWRPELCLICESEIWPNLLIEAQRRTIPVVMVNGRMSERSFARWYQMPRTSRFLLSCFEACLAQSQGDAERLAQLGAPRVSVACNLKFDVPAPPAEPNMLGILDGMTTGRPVWIAASTHPGEDELVLAAHLATFVFMPSTIPGGAPDRQDRSSGPGSPIRWTPRFIPLTDLPCKTTTTGTPMLATPTARGSIAPRCHGDVGRDAFGLEVIATYGQEVLLRRIGAAGDAIRGRLASDRCDACRGRSHCRCQRTTVSGHTTISAERQSRQA